MAAIASPGTTGNDTIIPGDGGDTLYGDPFDVIPLSHGRGGNDLLSATGDYNTLFGDAQGMSGDGRGGNDRLSATGADNTLYGDAQSISEHGLGGNDVLSAIGNYNTLLGDAQGISGHGRGGNDILYHASRYLSRTLSAERYTAPAIVDTMMAEGRNGLKSGQGFYDYQGIDVAAYRLDVLRRTLGMLKHAGLFRPPVTD